MYKNKHHLTSSKSFFSGGSIVRTMRLIDVISSIMCFVDVVVFACENATTGIVVIRGGVTITIIT